MNPYQRFASSFAQIIAEGKALPLGGIPPRAKTKLSPDAPIALIFSPHPDDECLIGGFALRLMRETGMKVVNVAVTQGSNKSRQEPRLQELKDACEWLGFDLEQTAPDGLEKVNLQSRIGDPARWLDSV